MKSARHSLILRIIEEKEIETQEDLANELKARGAAVTQATVSRDIKDLRLIKSAAADGKYKYATVGKTDSSLTNRFIRIFSDVVLSIEGAGNIIVLKTMSGSANVAGEAIDALRWPEIKGNIAGDNTVFVAIEDASKASEIIKKLNRIIK